MILVIEDSKTWISTTSMYHNMSNAKFKVAVSMPMRSWFRFIGEMHMGQEHKELNWILQKKLPNGVRREGGIFQLWQI